MKHLPKLTQLNASLEAIRWQDGSFFRDLTAVLTPFINGTVPTKTERSALGKSISSVIKKYTNLTIEVVWSNCYAISVPDWHKDHVLMERWKWLMSEEELHGHIDKSKDIKVVGEVDLIKAYVSGFYAEQVFTLTIDTEWFTKTNIKAEHHAAVISHEIGHAFTMCEMIDRTVYTNQILSRLTRELTETDANKRKTSIQKAGKDLDLSQTTIDSACNSANTEVVTTILLTGLFKDGQRNTKAPFYNWSVAEQMADEFATRMGGGAYIIEILDRMNVYGTAIQKRSAAMYYVLEFVKTASSIMSITFLPAFIICAVWIVLESTDSDGTYDTPFDRFKRVRNQIIEAMKNYNATKEVINDYQEQLVMIDNVMKLYTNRQQWWGIIADYLFHYTAIKDRDFQQQLEAMAANELFRAAQSIKHV